MIGLLACAVPLQAQPFQLTDSLTFYGSIRSQLARYDQKTEIQNNGSRIGMFLNNRLKNGFTCFVKTEWATNIVNNDYTFNLSSVTGQDIGAVIQKETNPAISLRLGYLGMDLGQWGTLAIGKQWSVYYDVSGWTDNFLVFGGQASGTYLFGTDGGVSGTGRAGKAITYRNTLGRLRIGGQVQLLGARTNYGGALAFNFLDHFEAGIAANHAPIPRQYKDVVFNLGDKDVQAVAGLRYSDNHFYAAVVYNYKGADMISIQKPDTAYYYAYLTDGIEVYTKYSWQRWGIYGGINMQFPKVNPQYISADYQLAYLALGAEYYLHPRIRSYFEMKIDNSTDAMGTLISTCIPSG